METLKQTAPALKFVTFETECKQQKNDLIIEGFANRFSMDGKLLVDRGNDLIPPQAFNLDEFKSLPIIFFNHDRDQPIGKATAVQVKEDGLYIKAKLSQSDHPEVKRVRTLVKEGILKAFSVGFDPIKIDQEEVDGKKVNVIKEANLLEVSVVSLPMAQHSLFNVTSKSLSEMPITTARNVLAHPEWFDVKQGIPSQPLEAELSNPIMDIMKQGNVLLGALIREIQLMSEKIDFLQAPPTVNEEVTEPMEEETEEMETESIEEGEKEGDHDEDEMKEGEEEEGKNEHYEDEEKEENCASENEEKKKKKLTIIDRYSEVCNKILANTGH